MISSKVPYFHFYIWVVCMNKKYQKRIEEGEKGHLHNYSPQNYI